MKKLKIFSIVCCVLVGMLLFNISSIFSQTLPSQTVSESNHTNLDVGDLGDAVNALNLSGTDWEWIRWAAVNIIDSERSFSRMKANSASEISGDPGSNWQAGLFVSGVWTPGGYAKKSSVMFRGVEKPDATAKVYTPKFQGTVEFFGSSGTGTKEYTWDVKANYEVSFGYFIIYVKQPVPGTRAIFLLDINNSNKPFTVGHTYWSTEIPVNIVDRLPDNLQQYANNTYGYWPINSAGIDNETDPGLLKDDSGEPWNVRKKYPIKTFNDLESLLLYTKNLMASPGTYHLQSNNCSTIAIKAGKKANIDVPDTIRRYDFNPLIDYIFIGNNPGDLGQDLIQQGGADGP
jgi:hypothetical protein